MNEILYDNVKIDAIKTFIANNALDSEIVHWMKNNMMNIFEATKFRSKSTQNSDDDNEVDEQITFPLEFDDDSLFKNRYIGLPKDESNQQGFISDVVEYTYVTYQNLSCSKEIIYALSDSKVNTPKDIFGIIQIILNDFKGIGLVLNSSTHLAPLTLAIAACTKCSLYAFEVIYKYELII